MLSQLGASIAVGAATITYVIAYHILLSRARHHVKDQRRHFWPWDIFEPELFKSSGQNARRAAVLVLFAGMLIVGAAWWFALRP